MNKLQRFAAASALLICSAHAFASTANSGMVLIGGLETGWSSDLQAQLMPQYQSLHPTATGLYGSTSPVTTADHLFAGESITANLSVWGLSGSTTVIAPPVGTVDGQIYHMSMVLHTPAVDYYGMSIHGMVNSFIYLSGGSSNQLYYGLRVSETTAGGADGGATGNNHVMYVTFNDSYSINTPDSNFSYESFGSTTVKTWSGGSGVNSSTGSGFVSLDFQPGAGHYGGGVGPGQTTTYDLWLTLSSTPVTSMPSAVPEPETFAMMISGLSLIAFLARRKRRSV